MTDNQASFEIEVNGAGMGKLVVNGEDVSNRILGFTLASRTGFPTILQLDCFGGGKVEGVGIVEVSYPKDQAAGLKELLGRLDPKKIEEAAMERLGFDGDAGSLGEAIFLTLLEAAQDGT